MTSAGESYPERSPDCDPDSTLTLMNKLLIEQADTLSALTYGSQPLLFHTDPPSALIGGEHDRSHSPNIASEHGLGTSRERGLALTRGESNKSLLVRTPSGRGLGGGGGGGGGSTAGGGGGGGSLQRGLSEKGGGLENHKNGLKDMGMKRHASEKLNLTSNTTSNGKFQPSSLANERKPSGKFPLERQASVNMGNSTSGKSHPADSRPPR